MCDHPARGHGAVETAPAASAPQGALLAPPQLPPRMNRTKRFDTGHRPERGQVDLNRHVGRTLKPALLGLAAFYMYLAGQSLLVWSSVSRTPPTLAAAAVAAGFVILAWLVSSDRFSGRLMHPACVLASLMVVGHTLFAMRLDPSSGLVGRVALMVVASGLVVASLGWLFVLIVVALGSLVLGATLIQGVGFPDNAVFSLIAAVITAFAAQRIRQRALQRLVGLEEEAEAEREARELSEQRYRLAVDGSNDGLYDWDLARDTVYFSSRWLETFGLSESTLDDASPDVWLERVHPDDRERVQASLDAHWCGNLDQFEEEHRILHSDGDYRWVLARGVSTRDADGNAVRMAGSVTDMTARGLFDPLTGLPNRRLLLDRLDRLLSSHARAERPFALLFVDLDRFKLINDTLGHHAGDALLVEAASRLQSCVRASDTVARLGGDEFVVLLDRIELPEGVQITVNRIRQKFDKPLRLGGRELRLEASIGAVLDTLPYDCGEDIVRDADTAMYEAKQRNCEMVVFDIAMRERLTERLHLEEELRQAVDHEQFTVQYQPIVEISSGKLAAFEALVRWQHPERGMVSPAEFIPIMEETGLIVPLGVWVLRTACREMQEVFPGTAESAPSVSVNLSRVQLRPALVAEVSAALSDSGLDGGRLKLEVTETAILEQPRLAAETLTELKTLGVRVMMDDFGTGHSSLAMLQLLPIDQLKIDRSFIDRVGEDREGTELVRGIIAMCKALNLAVVAEGIETAEQLESLRSFECDLGQGYLFARPAPLQQDAAARGRRTGVVSGAS